MEDRKPKVDSDLKEKVEEFLEQAAPRHSESTPIGTLSKEGGVRLIPSPNESKKQ